MATFGMKVLESNGLHRPSIKLNKIDQVKHTIGPHMKVMDILVQHKLDQRKKMNNEIYGLNSIRNLDNSIQF